MTAYTGAVPSSSIWLAALGGILLCLSCQQTIPKERQYGPAVEISASPHPVTINQPRTLGSLDTRLKDHVDTPVGVSCRTCHGSSTGPGLLDKERPEGFHDGLKVTHGQLSCNACHDSDRSRLHLADGQPVEFHQAIELCAQCHGVQYRDFRKGSHGGMSGYWDLKRGPRERNHCTDCHSAHQPVYQPMRPVHPPKDRYLEWPREEKTHD